MEFEFTIPSVHADLLNTSNNKYYVATRYDIKQIPNKLREAKNAMHDEPGAFIQSHFDTFFWIVEHATEQPLVQLLRASDFLYKSVDQLGNSLINILQQSDIRPDIRNHTLNTTKMLIYILVQTVKAIDKVMKATNDAVMKKGRKAAHPEHEVHDWETKRYEILLQMFNVLQLPIEKLWDPPIAEESFINLFADLSYRTLEHPTVKIKNVSCVTFQILGTAIKRFNHALIFPVRILQLLENCEISVAPIAGGLMMLHNEFGITTILSVFVKEMLDHLSLDGSDNVAAKHFSMFITELGNLNSSLMVLHVATMAEDILSLDSYTLRNCILSLMGEIIISELTSEDLSEELKETRDDFLEDLLSHLQDISAHVRSKVVQIWMRLKTENSVPLSWQHRVLEVAVERLEDKSSMVRKNAIILLKSFLEHNPFSAKLSIDELNKRYEESHEKLQAIRQKMVEETAKLLNIETGWEAILPEIRPVLEEILSLKTIEVKATETDIKDLINSFENFICDKEYHKLVLLVRKGEEISGNYEKTKNYSIEDQCLYYESLIKSYFLVKEKHQSYEEDFKKAESAMNFLKDSVDFSNIIINAMPKLLNMLMSKANSDVNEAVDFFTSAYMFGICNMESGLRQMLFLVWSNDKEKRDVITDAYKRVLLTSDQSGRTHSVLVVRKLLAFLEGLTDGHYIAFEELIKEWVLSNDIDAQMIQVMFEIYTYKLPNTSQNESRLAIQMLILCSATKPSIVTANVELIEKICFDEGTQKDSRIYASTLNLLMNKIPDQTDNPSKYYKRLDVSHPSIQNVIRIFHKYFLCLNQFNFDDICISTFSYIYKLCKTPNIVAQQIIQGLYEKLTVLSQLLKSKDVINSDVEMLSQAPVFPTQSTKSSNIGVKTLLNLPLTYVTRFVFIIGYATMRELIYLDIDVYSNLKYRQDLKESLKAKHKTQAASAALRRTINESAMSQRHSTVNSDTDNEDDVVGASTEDNVAEQITYVLEQEMLFSNMSILRKVVPLVIEVLKFPGRFKDEELQQAAVLALIRIMTVSANFCEENIPFLMNIFTHTKSVKIKCNIVIGMSDFTFRFPNVIEPWSELLYSTLLEEDSELRLTTCKVLAHLISHEMILVKGQISDLALCLVDDNIEIRTLTEQFFKEIANKSNILYNALPDIISRLSDEKLHLKEEKYRIIMKHIMGLISKDRQVESLVEKLCARFRITTKERQWRDIAYCLSLMTYNEKTMKKLTENIQHFKDKVQVQEVYDSFRIIISNTSKLAKVELKNAIQEFDSKLEDCLSVPDDENLGNTSNEIVERPPVKRTTARGKTAPKIRGNTKSSAPVRSRRGVRKVDTSSDSDNENQPPLATKIVPVTIRASRSTRSKVIEESTSSDDDAIRKPPPKKGKNPKN